MQNHFLFRVPWLVLAASICAGCGGEEGAFSVVSGRPSAPTAEPLSISITAEDDVTALAGRGTKVFLGAGSGVYGLNTAGTGLSQLDIWGDGPTLPTSTGAVRVMGRRSENVLIAAENGLFHTSGDDKLLQSPAQSALEAAGISTIRVLAIESEGIERIWVGADKGLFEIENATVSEWSIEGTSGAPTAILPNGSTVFVAFGDRLFELDTAANEAAMMPYDFGTIHAMTRGGSGSTYIAADNGLFERSAQGSYTQYTLSDGDALPAWGAVFDPKEGVFAVTAAGVVVAKPGARPTGVAALPAGMTGAHAAADDIGTVWIGAGKQLEGLKIGSTVTFDADVALILDKYCASCHATGTQYSPVIDFSSYEVTKAIASKLVARVSAGTMPPAGSPAIPAEAAEILLRWEASGVNR